MPGRDILGSDALDFPWTGTAICFGDILSREIVEVATITVTPFCATTLVTCEV
jgi:hypothetical protein